MNNNANEKEIKKLKRDVDFSKCEYCHYMMSNCMNDPIFGPSYTYDMHYLHGGRFILFEGE